MGFKRNFVKFIIIFTGAIAGVSCVLYYSVTFQNNLYIGFLGALLGGMITLAPYSYINFIANPYLEIIWNSDSKYVDIHRPSMRIFRGSINWDRKHIRVIIRNDVNVSI